MKKILFYFLVCASVFGSSINIINAQGCNSPVVQLSCGVQFFGAKSTTNNFTSYSCATGVNTTKDRLHRFTLAYAGQVSILIKADNVGYLLGNPCNPNNCLAVLQGGTSPNYITLQAGTYFLVIEHLNNLIINYGVRIDCPIANPCQGAIALTCGVPFSKAFGTSNNFGGYNCATILSNSNEDVHTITLTNSGMTTITIDVGDVGYLLSSCNSQSCIAELHNGGNNITLQAGTYFLIVEHLTTQGRAGYTVQIDCPSSNPCQGAIPLTCGQFLQGMVQGGVNNFSSYACLPSTAPGTEHVHTFTLNQQTAVDFRISNGNTGYLLSTCNPNSCIVSIPGDGVAHTYPCLQAGTYFLVIEHDPNNQFTNYLVLIENCNRPCRAPSEEIENSNLAITSFPNPIVDGNLKLVISGADKETQTEIQIFSIDGRMLITTTATGNKEETIDVSKLSPGMYIVKAIQNGQQVYTSKFQKL